MRPAFMKVPPLQQLYHQKHSYEMHRRKVQQIMADRKSSSVHEAFKEVQPRRQGHNFERQQNTRSLEIARANSHIVKKIREVKPSVSFSEQGRKSESRYSRSMSDKNRLLERERENYRIKTRVSSVSSALKQETLMRDYNRSLQIKNRITHFRTQHDQRVVLKASRYLGPSSQSETSLSRKHKGSLLPLPEVGREGKLEKAVMQSH
jgi:hypothetical protein